MMNSRREDRERYIENAKATIQEAVDELDIEADITGRPKHIFSIYKKMRNQKKQFSEIYDLLALRVIVPSIKDCYGVLGAIHTKWKPMPGRFKDYIAMPKANMYQSLHTTVLGPDATPLEVQIRTFKMHEIAEYGVAAHWAYKEGITTKAPTDEMDQHISWFRDIIELQTESNTASDFMDSIKQDIFKDKVYVFSPKGDVMELPRDSSTLDFAYHVHTEVGNQSTGAKVNGKIVPLNYKLKNGDIVEMLTSSSSFGPSRDWLKYVNTSKAKNRIKHFFKTQQKDENIQEGRELMQEHLERLDFTPKDFLDDKDRMHALAERFNYKNEQDLYAALGFGEIKGATVVARLTEEDRRKREQERQKTADTNTAQLNKEPEKMKIRHEDGVIVQGADNLLLRLSKCCNPVPGDDIVGYVTRGRGISVHRRDCANVKDDKTTGERLIEVEWENTKSSAKVYDSELQITGYDRTGLLNDVLQVINTQTDTLRNVVGQVNDEEIVVIKVKVGINNLQDLKILVDKIKKVPDVYSVKRLAT